MAVMGKAKEAGLPLMKLIKLRGMPILQQLHLEERLLRTSSDNWCLINDGTNSPAIVMGLSGIMSWSGLLYSEVFKGLDDFRLRENDYVFGDRKFGGNAQSITKNRWIHHTSFLWDYEVKNMSYLKLPAKAPQYRLTRSHMDFICRMKEYLPRSEFIERTIKALGSQFSVKSISLESIDVPSVSEYVHTTKLLTEQEIQETCIVQT
ncbi:hypothetical protein PHAVU_008G037200 [Phaseolus vulgaris]